ncbi:MAG: tyrosine-type recombinase/integrase [Flavobacteriales bacterium]|nr:tyrosine-type recombinase/integrase [Flavobacteriales bacterium]
MKLKDYLEEKYSITSTGGYQNMINRYLLALGQRAEKATYSEVLDYIGQLREQNLHPKSLRNHLFAIKIYYSYLIASGKRKDHPCRYLNLKDQINRQIQVESLYSKQTLQELYKSYRPAASENERRDKIIISLLIYQALTVLEISQIKTADVNLEEGTVKIKAGGKNKARTLSLKPNQILLFHRYQKEDWKRYHRKQKPGKRSDYLLMNTKGLKLWPGSINRMINKKRAKHQRLTPLKIRQSVIAHLLKENHDIRIVQEFAGHKRTASTESYKQSGLEELKSLIDTLHPLQAAK